MARKNKKNNEVDKLSEIALRNNIRVSKPYGYYPEDVDNVISKLENLISTLETETKNLEKQLNKVTEEKRLADTELTKMKLEMSIMDIPDTSMEEDFAMMSRLSNINESVGTMPESIPSEELPMVNIDILENPTSSDGIMFEDLVSQPPVNTYVEKPKSNVSSIFTDSGELDII